MEDLEYIICKAFSNYYEILKVKGKGDLKELKYISTIEIINRFLQSELSSLLNKEGLSVIKQAISCIQFNSCFVEHFDYDILEDINIFKTYKVRISENEILRVNNNNILRIKA